MCRSKGNITLYQLKKGCMPLLRCKLCNTDQRALFISMGTHCTSFALCRRCPGDACVGCSVLHSYRTCCRQKTSSRPLPGKSIDRTHCHLFPHLFPDLSFILSPVIFSISHLSCYRTLLSSAPRQNDKSWIIHSLQAHGMVWIVVFQWPMMSTLENLQ